MLKKLVLMAAVALGPVSASAQATAIDRWMREALATPFHAVPGVPALAASDISHTSALRANPLPDSAVSGEKVFGYALVAAFVPMIPALVSSMSDEEIGSILWALGGMAVTLVSVPIAATAAGATSGLRTIVGAAIGLSAGVVFGGIAGSGLGDSWFVPTYSVTMALATTIAVVAR